MGGYTGGKPRSTETCSETTDQCDAGTPVVCDDAVSCTVDACNEATDSCDHTPDDGYCDNGLYCDGVETCDAVNGCAVGTPVACDDGVACTEDSCNETTDSCDHTPVMDVVLSDDTILTTQVFDACSTITVGPDWAVMAPGNVTLRAGVAVIFLDGTMVGLDAQLSVEVDPSLMP